MWYLHVLCDQMSECQADVSDVFCYPCLPCGLFGFFLLAGIFSSLGPVLLYFSLQYADLVIVAPLASTTPLFVLLMSYLFLRADEIFTTKVVMGTIATVLGVMMVTMYGIA